ncbi:MAG TPA: multiheme c-type cytochrome [Terriglobia bacterium]|nr:multiheme c-type cytochrome [Terriglobia bacterium]
MESRFKSRNASLAAALAAMVMAAWPAWSAHPCAECHPKEVAGYAATQMAHSLGHPGSEPSGKYFHAPSKTQFTIQVSHGRMIQRMERGGVTSEYPVAYEIGSGTHAFAYVIQLGDHLFQSPLGYFSGRGWAMSPGYENAKAPDFLRPITPDCLVCHAGKARPIPKTFSSYQSPPFEAESITCERCHGPVEAHLRNPVPGSIVNPATLPPRARDSVCEQCHLAGEERVPNPGKQVSDFRPGEKLEDVYSVYVSADSRDPARPAALRVISQVQQLALSMCARKSGGKLWCGTCHDPHFQPSNPRTYFREKCLSCHGAVLLKTHAKPNLDCIGCHMPRRPVTDGAHTVFTDHRIARRPPPARATVPAHESLSLVAWHEPQGALAQRNRGIADIKVGERQESFPLVNQGFDLLRDCWGKFPKDPPTLTGLGDALLTAGQGAEAAAAFEQAIQIEPHDAVLYLHAGLAWKQAGELQKATEDFEKVLQLDSLMEQPYRELISIYSQTHNSEKADEVHARFMKAFQKTDRTNGPPH